MAKLSDQQIANVALASGWRSVSDIAIATAIALAESGGDSSAVNTANTNGTTDRGLWQVNSVHGYDPAVLFTPLGNGRAAYAIYRKQGWRAWSVYNSQRYRVFLPRGMAVAGKASASGGGTGTTTGGLDPNVVGAGVEAGLDAAFGVISADANPLKPLADFGSFITDSHNWVRVGLFLGGGTLILYALFTIDAVQETAKKTAKAALAVAVVAPK